MADPTNPTNPTGITPVGQQTGTPQSADAQSEQANVLVKVRAKRERGFIRGGVHWPPSDTYRRVTETVAKQLENEPLLQVSRISEGDVPAEHKSALEAEADLSGKTPEQQRDELVDGEFPRLGRAPSGSAAPTGSSDQNEALRAQHRARPAVDATGRVVPDSDPRREQERDAEAHSLGAGAGPGEKKKR